MTFALTRDYAEVAEHEANLKEMIMEADHMEEECRRKRTRKEL